VCQGCEPEEELRTISHIEYAGAHQYTIAAPEFIELGIVGLTLTGRTTLFVVVVKGLEVVVINVIAAKDIGDELHY
jgi:hypothetical protein